MRISKDWSVLIKKNKGVYVCILVDCYGVKNVYSEDGFIFVNGELPVTLAAYLDTIHEVHVREDDIVVNKNIISSLVGIGGMIDVESIS